LPIPVIVGASFTEFTGQLETGARAQLSVAHRQRDRRRPELIGRRAQRHRPVRPRPAKDDVRVRHQRLTDELPLTVKLAAGVSASPTVKPIVLEGVSSLVTCAATLAIVGALLVAVTVS